MIRNKLTFTAIVPTVTFGIVAVALATGLTFSLAATAESISDDKYKFLEKNIETEFTAAKLRCNSLSSVNIDRCISEAESIRNASKVELDARYKGFISSKSDPQIAKSDSSYLVVM